MPLSFIVQSMPSLDIAMPLALMLVVSVALILNKRVEGKLMTTVEQKEFKIRDVILLVVFMVIVISVIAYTSLVAPEAVFQNVFLIIFLGSYTMLLFTFSYVFSNLTKKRAQLISLGFGVIGAIAGLVSLLGSFSDGFTVYRAIAFFSLAGFCFGSVIFEQKKAVSKARWYIAAQPPALFLLLMIFFNVIYGGAAQVWFPFLMDVFGFTFAILIILYLSSLFSWKTVGLFAVLLTTMDIILVIVTPVMLTTANTFVNIGLPVLVFVPNVPLAFSATTGQILMRGLGLGDFFFAGVLAVQAYNKFGKKTGFASVVAMAVAFGIWEAFLPDIIKGLIPIVGRNIGGFPGTLMIITGWAPVIAVALFIKRRNNPAQSTATSQPTETPKEQNLPIQ